jgi:membrane complex biogenesis BtpA family protein
MKYMNNFKKYFNKKRPILIGSLHFPPLLGFSDFPGLEVCKKRALEDLAAFENGGVDAIIFENNYDVPHLEFVGPETVACMAVLGKAIMDKTKIPVGVDVLWNDYRAGFSLAKTLGLKFIRVPVFVDDVKTSYGFIKGRAKEISIYRKKIGAGAIAVFADIHVKHSKIVSRHTLVESAKLAIKAGADALIVTGRWTGEMPDLEELKSVRRAVGNFPILAGSGVSVENAKKIFRFADGAIISTSLKKGNRTGGEVNLKKWTQKIDVNKVKKMVKASI